LIWMKRCWRSSEGWAGVSEHHKVTGKKFLYYELSPTHSIRKQHTWPSPKLIQPVEYWLVVDTVVDNQEKSRRS
jgi:hypothetical protein